MLILIHQYTSKQTAAVSSKKPSQILNCKQENIEYRNNKLINQRRNHLLH